MGKPGRLRVWMLSGACLLAAGCGDVFKEGSPSAPRPDKKIVRIHQKMADVKLRLEDLVPTYALTKERLEQALKAGDLDETWKHSEKALFLNKDLLYYLLQKYKWEKALAEAVPETGAAVPSESLQTLPGERAHLLEAPFSVEELALNAEYKVLQGLIADATEKGKGNFIEFYQKSNQVLDRKSSIATARAELLEQDAADLKDLTGQIAKLGWAQEPPIEKPSAPEAPKEPPPAVQKSPENKNLNSSGGSGEETGGEARGGLQ